MMTMLTMFNVEIRTELIMTMTFHMHIKMNKIVTEIEIKNDAKCMKLNVQNKTKNFNISFGNQVRFFALVDFHFAFLGRVRVATPARESLLFPSEPLFPEAYIPFSKFTPTL